MQMHVYVQVSLQTSNANVTRSEYGRCAGCPPGGRARCAASQLPVRRLLATNQSSCTKDGTRAGQAFVGVFSLGYTDIRCVRAGDHTMSATASPARAFVSPWETLPALSAVRKGRSTPIPALKKGEDQHGRCFKERTWNHILS